MTDYTIDPLVAAAVQAGRAWAEAGLARRLQVLEQAGAALAERQAELRAGLRADGLSDKLATYYGAWVVRSARPELLARYAHDHSRWVASGQGGELMLRRPDGLVLLVVPGNSPTLNAATLFSILLPGNAVIVRSPTRDQGVRFLTEQILGHALAEHGFSPDLVPVVTSRSRPFLARFFEQPAVRTVVFFGNSRAGQAVADRGHELGKKVVLELEGSDHTVVWKDADLPAAVRSTLHAFDFSTTPCPIPKHVLVHDAVHDRFVAALRAAMPGCDTTIEADPVDGNLVPLGDPARFDDALGELAGWSTLHTGGYRMRADGTADPEGAYAAPTLVTVEADDVGPRRPLRCFDEEISYPLVPVVRFRGPDERIAEDMAGMVCGSAFGLRTSVWADDPEVLGFFARRIGHVGMLVLNDEHSQCPDYAAPWGGPRRSGGPYGENHLFWMKTSHLQALACTKLTPDQQRAVFDALGVPRPASLEPPRPQTRPGPRRSHGLVDLAVSDRVAWLTLDRPERHNAVDRALAEQLARAIGTLAQRDDLVAVVLRGAGPSFCSGGDLEMLQSLDASGARAFMTETTWSFRKLERLDVPVLAEVHGFCLGGGFELALHCDEILAADEAVFAFPETHAGYVTTAGSVARLVAAVGSVRARHLLLSGARIRGPEAHRIGLTTVCAPASALAARVAAHLEVYRSLPPGGVAAMKQLVRAHLSSATTSWIQESEAFESLVAARGGPR